MNLLEAESVSKTYGSGETEVRALKNVSFSVPKGEFVAVIGESGSGKSTLLNMLGALDVPSSGKVYIDGRDIFAMKERELTIFRRRNIGFIFQAFNLIPELSVEQNMMFPVLLDYQKPDRRYLEELLRVLNLTERRKHLPGQLSGGQQQRVAIGRALLTRPALILADEPTGNLDSQNSREVISLLKSASKTYEQTIVMITHNSGIAQCADRILRVSDGVVKDFGRVQDIRESAARKRGGRQNAKHFTEMPSDEMPESEANGRYLRGGRQNAKHFTEMPSDEMPESEANGRYLREGGGRQ